MTLRLERSDFPALSKLTGELGDKGYKIVNLNFNTNGYPQPYERRWRG